LNGPADRLGKIREIIEVDCDECSKSARISRLRQDCHPTHDAIAKASITSSDLTDSLRERAAQELAVDEVEKFSVILAAVRGSRIHLADLLPSTGGRR
jgi:hypothetical protein